MPDEPILSVNDLSVGFSTERGLTRVLERVSFEVRPREILAIVGESGSGKSITSLAIMGLIESPSARIEGSVRYRGRELLGLNARDMRAVRGAEIAMIFQDPMTALTPVYTIGHQIAEALYVHQSLSRRGARARTIELLGEMGIPDPKRALDRYPHQLSGGMRQRAMIAMALSCNPSLLIADEPTTALDVTVQAQILDLIGRLRRDFGSSIIFITHDMGVVAETADRVMVMYAGTVVERGDTRDVLATPAHPYSWGLLQSIPPMHGPRPHRLTSIGGAPPSPANRPSGCPYRPRCPWAHIPCEAPPPIVQVRNQETACILPTEGRDVTALGRALVREDQVA